jgi:hypothetical protein
MKLNNPYPSPFGVSKVKLSKVRENRMRDFVCKVIRCWEEFNEAVREMASIGPSEVHPWLYRGQTDDYPLMTTIERALVRWDIPLKDAGIIEFQTIREFRRRLPEPEYHRVQGDTLYCLSLMQHHGAPTRLLDCTYSPFVAAAFAMENGIFSPKGKPLRPVVWCFNAQWCTDEAKKKLSPDSRVLMRRRNSDARRNDTTFIPLFRIKSSKTTPVPKWKFVKVENPLYLNERLTAQQGAFLCPADIGTTFVDNLQAMCGWEARVYLQKLCLELDQKEARKFARNLKDMNISFAALFPDLDGFAKSINQQIGHYHLLGKGQSGLG